MTELQGQTIQNYIFQSISKEGKYDDDGFYVLTQQ